MLNVPEQLHWCVAMFARGCVFGGAAERGIRLTNTTNIDVVVAVINERPSPQDESRLDLGIGKFLRLRSPA